MARALIIAGLLALVVGILFHVAWLILQLAIPIGIGLLLVGVAWVVIERLRTRR